LGNELLQAIEASRVVVLLWSEAAANSRWVATEVLTSFHLNRFILPCVLDAAEFFVKSEINCAKKANLVYDAPLFDLKLIQS